MFFLGAFAKIVTTPPVTISPGFSQSKLSPGFLLQLVPDIPTTYDFSLPRIETDSEAGSSIKMRVFHIKNPKGLCWSGSPDPYA